MIDISAVLDYMSYFSPEAYHRLKYAGRTFICLFVLIYFSLAVIFLYGLEDGFLDGSDCVYAYLLYQVLSPTPNIQCTMYHTPNVYDHG